MREKKERNKLIIKEIIRGEYLIDIAKKYNISSAMVSKIKKRYLKKVEEEKLKELIQRSPHLTESGKGNK